MLNGARDVYGYIDTLKKQKFSNWESIIVDDGSTDGTIAMLNKCIAGDKHFMLFVTRSSAKFLGHIKREILDLKLHMVILYVF